MKETLDNQRKLEERPTGALHKVILGLDPNKTPQSNPKSVSEASSIRYQQLSNQHNKTVTENQQLQLHLATTTKALAKSENDNRNMLEKSNNLELKVQTLLQ